MKKIFLTLLCAAVMISCGGNKQKSAECDGNHAECTHQCEGDHKHECDGNHDECTHQCEGDHKHECDGNHQDCTSNCEEPTAASPVILNAETFAQKVADINNPEWKYLGDKPALVDFYADWCGPCKMIAPFLEEIAAEKAGELYIYKVNVDETPELAHHFKVQSIPTLVLIPMEGEPIVKIGAMPKESLVEFIESNLNK